MTKRKRRLINFLMALKGTILVAGASAYITQHEHITFWVLIGGAAIDEVIKFLQKDIKIDEES